MIQLLHIPEVKLLAFLRDVQSGYHPNPYHNFDHAVDVLQTCFAFLSSMHAGDLLTTMDVMVILIAAIGHDVDHPGVTNDFLVRTKVCVQHHRC